MRYTVYLFEPLADDADQDGWRPYARCHVGKINDVVNELLSMGYEWDAIEVGKAGVPVPVPEEKQEVFNFARGDEA